jgi:Zn-finger nucleic acid-binding protein
MKCPRCFSVLTVLEYAGFQVEVCSECRGEWLHAEELQKIVEHHDHVLSAKEIASLEAVSKPVTSLEDQDRDVLNCPHCETIELERFNYADTTDLLLHKCPECGGVWADKEQLEKLDELVEGWKDCLNQDAAKYAPVLKKIAAEERKEIDRDVSISRFGFVNAVLRRFCE